MIGLVHLALLLAVQEYDPDAVTQVTTSTMRFVMEDGSAIPKELAVFRYGACEIKNSFGTGTVVFLTRNAPCLVWATAVGIRTWRGPLRHDATIVLKRLGEHEGSEVSITVLKAPGSARKAYGKASQAMLRKKYAEAASLLEEAVQLYPDYALAWSELGRARNELGQFDEARKAISAAIRADAKYIKPYVQLAALEAAAKNWPACEKAADEAIALNAIEFPGAFYYRALAYRQAGDWKAAARLYAKAIQADPVLEWPQSRFELAEMLAGRGDWRTAHYVLDQFLEAKPEREIAQRARELREKIKAN